MESTKHNVQNVFFDFVVNCPLNNKTGQATSTNIANYIILGPLQEDCPNDITL